LKFGNLFAFKLNDSISYTHVITLCFFQSLPEVHIMYSLHYISDFRTVFGRWNLLFGKVADETLTHKSKKETRREIHRWKQRIFNCTLHGKKIDLNFIEFIIMHKKLQYILFVPFRLLCWISINGTLVPLKCSKFLLGLASTVILGFGPRRDPWPYYLFFPDFYLFWNVVSSSTVGFWLLLVSPPLLGSASAGSHSPTGSDSRYSLLYSSVRDYSAVGAV
jgi:hypothetical protein